MWPYKQWSEMRPFELSWTAVGCDQQPSSEGRASQSFQTHMFHMLGGLSNNDQSWAVTHWHSTLCLSGDAKASKMSISLTSEGNFLQVPCLHWLFISMCMPMCMCYSKSGRNATFWDVSVSWMLKRVRPLSKFVTYNFTLLKFC